MRGSSDARYGCDMASYSFVCRARDSVSVYVLLRLSRRGGSRVDLGVAPELFVARVSIEVGDEDRMLLSGFAGACVDIGLG